MWSGSAWRRVRLGRDGAAGRALGLGDHRPISGVPLGAVGGGGLDARFAADDGFGARGAETDAAAVRLAEVVEVVLEVVDGEGVEVGGGGGGVEREDSGEELFAIEARGGWVWHGRSPCGVRGESRGTASCVPGGLG